MKKNYLLKIIFSFILILSLSIIFTLRPKADSYNYDNSLNPLKAPYAYNIAKEIDLTKLSGINKRLTFVEIAKSNNELFIIGYVNDTDEGVLIVLDYNYQVKKVFSKETTDINLPKRPMTVNYSSGKLFIAAGRDEKVFTKDLINPLDQKVIANEYDTLDTNLETVINNIKSQLNSNELTKFNNEVNNFTRVERKIYTYNRLDQFNQPLPEILKFEQAFGLKTREAIVLNKPFRPLKLASHDNSSLLYCIAEGSSIGLLSFKKDGTFIKFIGSNKIEMSQIDKFWRKFIDDQVLDQLDQKIQANFSSLAVDEAGFIYTTTDTQAVSKGNQVQKFNAKGKNILLQDSTRPVIGDYYSDNINRSFFSFVDVSSYGTYLLYDRIKHRLFSYNTTGELLFAQGEAGNGRNEFNNAIDMKLFREDIAILDQALTTTYLKVLMTTTYGRLLNQASKNYHEGNFNLSSKIYDEIINLNNNSDFAHVGKGKIYMLEKEYEKACQEFKLANHGEFYAEAYEKYRSKKIVELFPLILSILFLVINTSVAAKKIFKKESNERKN